ncbi:MAG TPA: hypothetical protein VGL02_29115 [Streptomyces sp.]
MKAVYEDEEPISLTAWRMIGALIAGAVESVGGAWLAHWIVGFLHEWWPAIPPLPWQIALWVFLLFTAWKLFKDAIKGILKKVGGPFYQPDKKK